mmetsp:Transcript_134/g.487  ORF Transcript_134/g.487 Transcript_134/m.487 type:complete len:234 (+) Transcript_134:944-1645(+)
MARRSSGLIGGKRCLSGDRCTVSLGAKSVAPLLTFVAVSDSTVFLSSTANLTCPTTSFRVLCNCSTKRALSASSSTTGGFSTDFRARSFARMSWAECRRFFRSEPSLDLGWGSSFSLVGLGGVFGLFTPHCGRSSISRYRLRLRGAGRTWLFCGTPSGWTAAGLSLRAGFSTLRRFSLTAFLIALALLAYFNVLSVSSKDKVVGEQWASMSVRQFPPSESFNNRVSLLSLKLT